jgi:rhodanese-related sulfurtransferase
MKQLLIIALVLSVFTSTLLAQSTTTQEILPLPVDSFASKINRQAKPQIIDVRTPEEYEMNHIRGAVSVNLKEEGYLKSIAGFDANKPVFIYAIQNYRSGLLATELRQKGYKEVYELKSGIASWIGAGYPYYSSVKNGVSLADYKKIVSSKKLVLVDIGTRYCGACVKVGKLLDSLKTEGDQSYEIVKLELYNNPELAAALKEITAVPTVILYKGGKEVWKKTGLTFTKEEIAGEIEKAKNANYANSAN